MTMSFPLPPPQPTSSMLWNFDGVRAVPDYQEGAQGMAGHTKVPNRQRRTNKRQVGTAGKVKRGAAALAGYYWLLIGDYVFNWQTWIDNDVVSRRKCIKSADKRMHNKQLVVVVAVLVLLSVPCPCSPCFYCCCRFGIKWKLIRSWRRMAFHKCWCKLKLIASADISR